MLLSSFLILAFSSLTICDPSFDFNYHNVKGEMYDVPVNLMAPKKTPHSKSEKDTPVTSKPDTEWSPYDFTKFESYLNSPLDSGKENNRIKRRSKKRHHVKYRSKGHETGNSSTLAPNSRRQSSKDYKDSQQRKNKKQKKGSYQEGFDTYQPQGKRSEDFVEMPKDLYQAHLRPGVIFRIHMAEAIIKMQYRNYEEDRDESVIEADVEYLRLTRKVINDEITKFDDLKWLIGWFNNRSDLIQEHTCNTRYFAVGIPPTIFTHTEEYMKRMCLFDNVYIDHIPYVVGEDASLMAAVAPPVLHCDAATCTSVPFVDSIMFDDRLSRTNVRTVTRCQAGCRSHCKNDPDCLKKCSDRCLRT